MQIIEYINYQFLRIVGTIGFLLCSSGCRFHSPNQPPVVKQGQQTVAMFLNWHRLSLEEAVYINEPPGVLSGLLFLNNPKLGGRSFYLNLVYGRGLFSDRGCWNQDAVLNAVVESATEEPDRPK